jgi:hypothetical protein
MVGWSATPTPFRDTCHHWQTAANGGFPTGASMRHGRAGRQSAARRYAAPIPASGGERRRSVIPPPPRDRNGNDHCCARVNRGDRPAVGLVTPLADAAGAAVPRYCGPRRPRADGSAPLPVVDRRDDARRPAGTRRRARPRPPARPPVADCRPGRRAAAGNSREIGADQRLRRHRRPGQVVQRPSRRLQCTVPSLPGVPPDRGNGGPRGPQEAAIPAPRSRSVTTVGVAQSCGRTARPGRLAGRRARLVRHCAGRSCHRPAW